MVSRFGIEPGRYGASGSISHQQYSIMTSMLGKDQDTSYAAMQGAIRAATGRGIRNENLGIARREILGGLRRADNLRDALLLDSLSTDDYTPTKMGLPSRYRAVVRYQGINRETGAAEDRWLTLDSNTPFNEIDLNDQIDATAERLESYIMGAVESKEIMVIYDRGFN